MENKIKLFEDRRIRYAWDAESEEWFFSAVDVCYALSESAGKDPGAYWRKLKQRLKNEGSEVVTNCHGLLFNERHTSSHPVNPVSQSRAFQNVAGSSGS